MNGGITQATHLRSVTWALEAPARYGAGAQQATERGWLQRAAGPEEKLPSSPLFHVGAEAAARKLRLTGSGQSEQAHVARMLGLGEAHELIGFAG